MQLLKIYNYLCSKIIKFNSLSSMKKFNSTILFLSVALLLASCAGSKKIVYFQNVDGVDLSNSAGLYDARIMPKDILSITVFSSDPITSAPYNQTVQNTMAGDQISTGSSMLQSYLVDNDGNINFPKLGTIHVQGLTKTECEKMILDKISPEFNELPIVTVKMSSYRVTVTGEVNHPGVFPVTSEKMSVLEALAQAGDLTLYGRRDNILLLREDATGKKTFHKLDLKDANLINSPYYYVQQNDVIYVEPNKVRANNSTIGQSTTIWISVISILTSLASLIVNITR